MLRRLGMLKNESPTWHGRWPFLMLWEPISRLKRSRNARRRVVTIRVRAGRVRNIRSVMENKEKLPKFNPEFRYLENPRILELQRLLDDILVAEDENFRNNRLILFQERWGELLEKYSKETDVDQTELKQLFKFFRYNMRILDKGGMLLGRSRVGIFMSVENEKLINQFDSLVEE